MALKSAMFSDFHDDHFATLDQSPFSPDDHALAMRHAPLIRFDEREPFLPSVAGYTVFRQEAESPSFPRTIPLATPVTTVIEYAVWWDWDMGHLYELEHIWVHLDAAENLVMAEASWHGGYNAMVDDNDQLPVEDGRLVVFSEPGKHAFAPSLRWLQKRADVTRASCGTQAGKMGVHVTPLFEGIITDRNPLTNQLVHSYLEGCQFEPTFDFTRRFPLEQAALVPWDTLFQWIPGRMTWWLEQLAKHMPPHEYRVLRIAHRGASAYAQENSPSALKQAAELGSDMVEVDVRITADDVPVISHDATLDRVYGVPGEIAALTLAELKAATTGTGADPVLTFAELVEVGKTHGLGLYLDIKAINEIAATSMMATLDAQEYVRGVIFSSFRPDIVAEIKASRPDAVTSILFSSRHVAPVLLARAVKADYVHPCWERYDQPSALLTPDWLQEVRAAGLGIICWHEERSEEIQALQQLGVNGICSDQPDLLVPN